MKPKLKPKYLQAEQGGQRERWLISYTDFVTILLILFVAIAAQGFHAAPVASKPEPPPKPPLVATAQSRLRPSCHHQSHIRLWFGADEKLRSQGLDSQAGETRSGHQPAAGHSVSLRRRPRHAGGARRSFPKSPKCSTSVPNKVALVGHADSIPIHNKRFQSNWELSAARSVNLLEVLNTRYGISESRLSVQSYGSNDPKDSNDTEAGRAENRRVEILLLDEPTQ